MAKLFQKCTSVSNLLYFVIFLLIYSSRETFVLGDSGDIRLKLTGYILTLVAAFLLVFYVKLCDCTNNLSKYLFQFSILGLITCIINIDYSVKYLYEILLLFISYFIVKALPFEKFILIFSDIIYVLGLFSIIVYVGYLVTPAFIEKLPQVVNGNGLTRYFCGLSVIGPEAYAIPRNYGIFREPGVFIIYLCLGLLIEIFNTNHNKRKIFVLCLSLLTTFSTAGYIVAIFIVVTYLLFGKNVKRTVKYSIILIIIILYFIMSFMLSEYSLFNYVFGKFMYQNDSTDSRFGSIAVNLHIWLSDILSFLFGSGYTYLEDSFRVASNKLGAGGHNTNTILRLFAVHGFFFGILYLKSLYSFCRKHYNGISFCVLLVFFMLLSNEEIMTSFLIYIFPFYGISKCHYKIIQNESSSN